MSYHVLHELVFMENVVCLNMFTIKHVYDLKLNSKIFPPPLFIWLSITCEFRELVKNMSTKNIIITKQAWFYTVVHMTLHTFKREVKGYEKEPALLKQSGTISRYSNRDSNRLRISLDVFNIYTQFSIPSMKESSFPHF